VTEEIFALGIADGIGFTGVGILLLAFLLNLLGKISQTSFTYIGLNFLGASLACLASVLIHYLPFILLEGSWAIVSLVSFIGIIRRKGSSSGS
jgi:hypothetical protein